MPARMPCTHAWAYCHADAAAQEGLARRGLHYKLPVEAGMRLLPDPQLALATSFSCSCRWAPQAVLLISFPKACIYILCSHLAEATF
jgi:hypothetical protein